MTPPEQLVLFFDTEVNSSTCDVSRLTLQGMATFNPNASATFLNGSCSSSGSRFVQVSSGQWAEVQGNIMIATSTSNTFLSLDPGFIDGTDGSPSLAIDSNSALQASQFTANTNPPTVLFAILHFEIGFVGFIFPEAIDTNTVDPTGITIHFTNRETSMPDSITLTGGTVNEAMIGTQIEILFTTGDLTMLKTVSMSPYFVDIAAGTFTDGAGMSNPTQTGIQFSAVIDDVGPPQLTEFSIDLNVGTLSFTFNEPVATTPPGLDVSMIYLAGMPQNFSMGYNLSNSQLLSAENMNSEITITLSKDELNQIKADTDVCSIPSNCFLNLDVLSFSDGSGNFLSEPLLNFPPSEFIPDTTTASLLSYIVSLDSGMVTLEFSEPVDELSLNPIGLTIRDASKNMPQELIGAVVTSTQNFKTILVLQVPPEILNTVKLLYNSGGITLTTDNSTILDTDGNGLTPIFVANPLSPLSVEPDMTPPMLVSFEANDPQQRQLTLVFNEYVDPSTFDGTQLSLTLVSALLEENSYSSFQPGSASTSLSESVTYTFSPTDFVAPFSDQYNDAYNSGSFGLSSKNGLVADLAGNVLQGFTVPLFFSNVPQEVLSFDLDLDDGTLTLQFTEPVQNDTIMYSEIYIDKVLMSAPSGFNLSGSTFSFSDENVTMVTIKLDNNLLNQIKFDPVLCSDTTNCFLFLTIDSFRNLNGEKLLPGPTRLRASNVTVDMNSPVVLAFTLDLNVGQLTLSFTEPINPQSFNPMYLTILTEDLLKSTTLEGAVLSGVQDLNTFISVELAQSLNEVKILTIGGSLLTLTMNESAIEDLAGNLANPIPLSSAIEPSEYRLDIVPPTLTLFLAGQPEDMQITLIFDEYVLPSFWNGNQLMLSLNTLQGTFAYSGFVNGTVSTNISNTITYTFSPNEFSNEFSEQYTEAFFNGYIGLTTGIGLITDIELNQLQAISEPLASNNDSVIPDIVRPTLTSFDFDLNSGNLIMTFSENVTVLTISGLVRLQDRPINSSNLYALTRESAYTTDADVVTLLLDPFDLGQIKSDPDLASLLANTYLLLNDTFAQDASGNLLNSSQGAIEVRVFTPDTQAAQVISTVLDLNTETLSIMFSEPVSEVIDYTQITITGSSQNTPGDISFQDSTSTQSNNIVTIQIPVMVVNKIKSNTAVCTQRSNCYLFITASAFSDLSGNPLAALSSSFLVSTFTPDSTSPLLTSFTIDLEDGQITLSFSEAVLVGSLDPSQISLVSTNGDTVTLSSAFLSSRLSFDSVLVLTVGMSSLALNQAKLFAASGGISMFLFRDAITDNAANPITPILESNPLAAAMVIADRRRPSLLSFTPGTPEQRRLIFSFDEYVDPSTWVGTAITLTLNTPEGVFPYSDFSAGTRSSQVSDTVVYTFIESEYVAPFSTQYKRAFERGSIVLSGGSGLISDLSGNQVMGLSSNLIYMNVTRESIRPQLVSFTFSTTRSELVMTFSEPIIVLAVVNQVMIQDGPNSQQNIYPLTQNGTVTVSNNIVTLVLSTVDLNNIKANTFIGDSRDNTYLRLLPAFADDLNENPLLPRPAALQATTVENDVINTMLVGFSLDMDAGTITLSFNNVIAVSTVRQVFLRIQDTAQSSFVTYAPSSISTVDRSQDSQIVTILLHESDVNNLKSNLNLATSVSDTFINFPSAFANDIQGNSVVQILANESVGVSTYVRDSSPPLLSRFRLDMNSGTLRMTFSEPVFSTFVDLTQLTIQNSVANPTMQVSLTGGSVASNQLVGTTIDLTMSIDDVNIIKTMPGLATSMADTYLSIASNFVTDTSQNGIASTAAQATVYSGDFEPPQLINFDIDLTDNTNARITLWFNEPIPLAPTTILPALSLQNARSNPTVTLTLSAQLDTLSQTAFNQLQITLRSSFATRLLTDPDIGTSVDTLYVAITNGGITDYSGNDVVVIPSNDARRVRYICKSFVSTVCNCIPLLIY